MLERRFHTTGNLDECDFQSDSEILFPTLFAHNMRSFKTEGSTKISFPEYDEKIYEFHEDNKAGLKAFLELNPNKECIIKINGTFILHNDEIIPTEYRFYHSKIL
jgi:hypothetical protein